MGFVMQLNVGFASSEWITLAPGRIATRCVESDGFHYRASIFPSTGAEAGSFPRLGVEGVQERGAGSLPRERQELSDDGRGEGCRGSRA